MSPRGTFAAGGETVAQLKTRLARVANALTNPAPVVEILEFNLNGPKLAVRPFCNNADYWQVYFDTNRTIRELATESGYAAPEQHLVIRTEREVSAPLDHAVVPASSR